ncbi:hypothetical protein GCK32_006580 [Trichostrongylus colubriformis]|uniref:Uncharacterized protein n=1 Tax=Trichostrongylus colubriformis TaxID=6319 RepID=A0AAN8EVK3_TRICO
MEEFNWRDEKSFNITSDLSSFEEERTEAGDGDASANTLVQNETGSSVLGEPSTPTASNQCNWPSSVTPSGRLSLSQPELPAKSTPPTKTSRLNMSTGNISSGSGKPPRPYRAPLSQTLEENKHLREELAVLKSKLNVEKYKVAELTALQPREVQDILEEYYALQLSKFDLEGERKQMAEERRQLNLEIDNVEVRAQTKIEALERQLRDSEKKYQAAVQQNEQYTERIRQLEADIAKWEEVPTSIDGLKGEDSDWTIRSEGDIVSEELRKRLAMLEKENKALYQKIDEQRKKLEERAATLSDTTSQSRTFTVGSGCDVETLLQRIDHLEASLHIVEEERNKTSSALVAYMSRCHSLEKKIRNANLSYTNLTVPVQTKEEVWRLVENIRDVLRALGKQNKELRKECTLLLGRNDQSGLSPDSSGALSTPGRVNIPGTLVEKSLLFAEDFEKKQQEVMENLKSLTDSVANFDESLINILKDIGLSDDDAAEPRKSDAVVAEELANTDQANISQNRADPNNVSMLNASLVELMNRSMNTSKDIAGFKVKLVSLRDVMHRMFENLRSSGVLFEDILELLGSGTDEMRNLAERIRAMKFEWDSAIEEKHVVMEAIEETVVSVNRMQMELSAWEQSLNETSFRLDVSMAHSTTQCFSVQTAQNDEEVSPPQQELAELQAHISKNAEEISQLRSKIEEVSLDVHLNNQLVV